MITNAHSSDTDRGNAPERDSLYQAILKATIDCAIVATDRNGLVIGWNEGAGRILGWSEAEMRGRPIGLCFTPEDRAAGIAETEMTAALATGEAVAERWQLRKDGTRFWAHSRLTLLRAQDGLACGFLRTLSDQTERRKTEEALRESDASRELALQIADLGRWDHDWADGGRTYDARARAIMGFDAADPVSPASAQAIIHPLDRERIVSAIRRAADAEHGPYAEEYRILKADTGEERWVSTRGRTFFEQGRCVRFAGVIADITDRKHAETLLRESDAFTRLLLDSTEEAFYSLTPDGVTTLCNAAFLRMLGFGRAEDVLGKKLHAVIHHSHPDGSHYAVEDCPIYNAARTGAPVYVQDELFFRLDGTGFPVEYRVRPIWRDGALQGAICTFFDITERKRAEHELQTSQEALRIANATLEQRIEERTRELQIAEAALRQSQKMEAIGQLTGGIAHDFNNLLTGIIGSLDLMRRRISEGKLADLDRFMEAASISANRAASLTHRLLAFARRQPLAPTPVNVNFLVRSMEDLLLRTLGEQVELIVAADPDLWLAKTDANQLESALLNLGINARDAMPDGGKLTIETRNARLDERHTGADEEGLDRGDYVVIGVSDTGTGMTPDVLAKAFDPFFTTKAIGQGTGLGLSMIYGFAKQSGGHVRLFSETGKGTTVRLYLPRHRGEAVRPEAPSAEIMHRGGGQTVLIVEDDAAVRMLITELLDELGYAPLEAGDAQAAIPILESGRPIALMVSDVGLPGMNGRQLADLARQLRPGLGILFVTGYAEKAALRDSFLGSGMDMIVKPFAMKTLASKIHQMIQADAMVRSD